MADVLRLHDAQGKQQLNDSLLQSEILCYIALLNKTYMIRFLHNRCQDKNMWCHIKGHLLGGDRQGLQGEVSMVTAKKGRESL